MEIILTDAEFEWATQIGKKRESEALLLGKKDSYGIDPANSEEVHIFGACAELATAIAFGLDWNASFNTFKEGSDICDISHCKVPPLQVRARRQEKYGLLVRKNDRNNDIFICVIGRGRKFRIVGWMFGKHAKQQKWLSDHGNRKSPAYFVPQNELKKIDPLRKLIHQKIAEFQIKKANQ